MLLNAFLLKLAVFGFVLEFLEHVFREENLACMEY